jgi:hypothetical protein
LVVARTPLRAPGHALTLEWSGETGVESSSTGYCRCGWQESASNQEEVRAEYRFHLMSVLGIDPQAWLTER